VADSHFAPDAGRSLNSNSCARTSHLPLKVNGHRSSFSVEMLQDPTFKMREMP
jgi:hypothetical protein